MEVLLAPGSQAGDWRLCWGAEVLCTLTLGFLRLAGGYSCFQVGDASWSRDVNCAAQHVPDYPLH